MPYGPGIILSTSDGGVHWTEQKSGTTADLDAVSFVDARHGWVVGWNGVILTTSDGGATWEQENSGTTGELNSVFFADTSRGWVIGGGGIMVTSDGGAHWSLQDERANEWLYGLDFIDASHGWAVGVGSAGPYSNSWGVILRTSDGGAHWSAQDPATNNWLFGVDFVDASHGWAVGRGGTILATSDGGAHWLTQSSGTTADFHGVSCRGASLGWAVGAGGTILATTNGGWPDRTPPTTTASGAASLWYRSDVSLTLTASDNAGGSGVDATYYQIDGGPWAKGASLTIAAPADHSADGPHTVSYYSTDLSGNAEAAKSVTVEIDTTRPVISSAYLGFVRQASPAGWANCTSHFGLIYRVDDNLSPTAAVKLEALNWRGKVVKAISLGQCPTGVQQTYRLPLNLSFLFGRWRVTATDLAGNSQSAPVRFRLFVRR
jgi:photosystem II stability/assembly factor-like uncharacterized protein